jgi:hypothetical protein
MSPFGSTLLFDCALAPCARAACQPMPVPAAERTQQTEPSDTMNVFIEALTLELTIFNGRWSAV